MRIQKCGFVNYFNIFVTFVKWYFFAIHMIFLIII